MGRSTPVRFPVLFFVRFPHYFALKLNKKTTDKLGSAAKKYLEGSEV